MGFLSPFCFASNANSFYGIAVDRDYSIMFAEDPDRLILIKSNENPTSAADVSWKVVSSVQASVLYDISGSKGGQLCYVDDKGVFTFIALSVRKTPTSPPVSAGLQYSPLFPATPNGNNTGEGGWKNIDIISPYSWTTESTSVSLYHVNDASGNNVVIHSYLDTQHVLNFGVLDNASLQLNQGPTWNYNSTYYDFVKATYHKDTLFIISDNRRPFDSVSILTIPLLNSTIPAKIPAADAREFGPFGSFLSGPNLTLFDISITSFFDDTYYFLYRAGYESGNPWLLTMDLSDQSHYKNATNTHLSQDLVFSRDIYEMYWADMGPRNGAPAFAFVPHVDFNNKTHIRGINLSGPNIGQWYNVSHTINVTDTFGTDPNPQPTDYIKITVLPSGDVHSTAPSTGLIVGFVLALLIAFAAAGSVFHRWRADRKEVEAEGKAATQAASQPLMIGPNSNEHGNFKMVVEPTGTQQAWTNTTQQAQAYAGGVPTTSSPMATQPGQQQFLFSAHPQPNFATSSGVSNGAGSPPGTLLSVDHITGSPSYASAGSPTATHTLYSGGQSVLTNSPVSGAPSIPLHSRPSP
ncbi:hypothetical protein BX616_001314 [Lobosporangium transversale]|uniref:Transmembrane protein n=1 Tax=Lobosporangium transversale TaxID=64571 RepID=A0A1Y2GPZ7_9FUNG|nr:hypothetical protein BCR41DRAFT_385948 [Lobosporangium transversale]KAF9904402.1 hypothetical protein BX616_001314 [Lobosporangium transversale]ORZ18277.1 hypothetical protein BCR41DRAFT_385948 [Lobosporangium transversale]|eukprot:XP_021882072.1 hypothetical protein BCR41DRAFT_385948 [Lobosporangium transversale]